MGKGDLSLLRVGIKLNKFNHEFKNQIHCVTNLSIWGTENCLKCLSPLTDEDTQNYHYADFTAFYSFSMAKILKQSLPRNLYLPSSEGEELLYRRFLTDYAQWVCSYDIPQESSYWVRPQHGMDCCCRRYSKLCLCFSTVANRRCWISPFTFISTFYRNMKRGKNICKQ